MKTNKKAILLLLALGLASTTLFAKSDAKTSTEVKKVKKKSKKLKIQKHTSNVDVESGIGYDSNPFLTPRNPYNDYTNTGAGTLVTPVKKSGVFTPLSINGDYEYRYSKDIRLLTDASFSGRYFYDKSLENANKFKANISTGIRFRMNKFKKETNNIDFNVFTGHVHEIYVDRDDGALKTTTGGDQSNRYQYTTYGAELKYNYDFRKVAYMFRGSYENRDYATPASWSSLDHTYTRAKLQGKYMLTKDLELGTYYEFRYADYIERKAYENVGGVISLVNPGMNLTYNDLKLFTSYKFNKAYKIDLDYLASYRTDSHLGYSDLLLHTVKFDNKIRVMKGMYSSLKFKYSLYDYKKAYAYDSLANVQIRKEASAYQIDLDTKYKVNTNLFTSLDLRYKRANSTDKRYEYDDKIAMVMLKYKY